MARSRFAPADITRSFRAERNQALYPVLKRLPYDFVVALIEGLEKADVIVPGRLFAGDSGGCAVGVTLRALDSSLRGRRIIWGRRLRRSVVSLRHGLAKRVTHLYALEQVFDRTVRLAQSRFPWAPPELVAKSVALWVADEAWTELVLREMNSEWLQRLARETTTQAAPGTTTQAAPELGAPVTAQPCFA